MTLRVGLDFDNTLIDYDAAFVAEAERQGVVAPGCAAGKLAVKAAALRHPDGEECWMRIQGQVYGPRIAEGRLIDGVAAFLESARARGAAVFVVSHKTQYGHFDATRTDLRDAARGWMRAQGFFDRFGLAEADVFFETTRDEKIARIAALGLDAFVDDLPEVLSDPAFPPAVRRLHFTPGGAQAAAGCIACHDWKAVHDAVFGS